MVKSIIMITLDCARPDHLGCYGYHGVDTPGINKIAREGLIFQQAIAQAPNTWVSHASIFTGCNPYKHGVRSPYTKLSSKVKTIAELLKDSGFSTAGFPAHTLLGTALGFNRGFDLYDLKKEDFMFTSDSKGHYFYRSWNDMWKRAQKWLLQQNKPNFLWLHYMGIHGTKSDELNVPKEFLKRYSPLGQYYDAKISWADKECISSVYSFLKDKNLLNDSIIVLFSDHGETIAGDSKENKLGYVYHNKELIDNVMKISLIMRYDKFLPQNYRVENQIRSIDIFPTILDLVKIPIPKYIDGRSLLPVIKKKESIEHTKFAYMENIPLKWIGIRTSDWKLILTDNLKRKSFLTQNNKNSINLAAQSAINHIKQNKNKLNQLIYPIIKSIYSIIKYFYHLINISRSRNLPDKKEKHLKIDPIKIEKGIIENAKVFALYNLKIDPDEKNDVSKTNPEIVTHLKNELTKMIEENLIKPENLNKYEQEEVTEKLEHLGYL